MENVLQAIEAKEQQALQFLEQLVNIDSGIDHPAGIEQVAHLVGDRLAAMGFDVQYINYPGVCTHLLAHKQGATDTKVMVTGHMDTVFPRGTAAARPFTIRDGQAYGPGVLDMKGGITTALLALESLYEAGWNDKTVTVFFCGDEETGHPHTDAIDHFQRQAQGQAAVFNMESGRPDGAVVIGRKGGMKPEIRVKGRTAHAGNEPENGRSAILEMAHKVIDIQKLTDYKIGITYNVGVIAGGIVPNAVPDYAKIKVDVRYIDPAQLPGIQSAMQKVADTVYVEGTSATVVMEPGIAPMQTTDGVKKLFEIVKKTYLENGWGNPYEKFVGGGSDSAYSVIAGVPTVCAMGVKGGRNHSAQEFAVVETLFERAKLLAASTLNLDAAE